MLIEKSKQNKNNQNHIIAEILDDVSYDSLDILRKFARINRMPEFKQH